MATTLTLASGPLTAVQTAADDVKAQDVIRRFALATGAAGDATNQQLLNHAAQQLTRYMVSLARRQKIAEAETTAVADAESSVTF